MKRKAEPKIDLTEPLELRLLRHRLVRIEQTLTEVPEPAVDDQTFRAQELRRTISELRALRRVTSNAIEAANAPSDLDRRSRNEATLDAAEQEARETALHFIGKLEREGDHRQVAVHRLDLIGLRERLARQFSMTE